jgi:hypothetical protein
MNDHTNKIVRTMENIAVHHKLPVNYQSDLDTDLKNITRYKEETLLWLLRTHGTVLIPIKLGVDPGYVTHWLWGNHGQEVIPYLIDTKTGTVEEINFDKAEKLIMQPPSILNLEISNKYLTNKVNKVLERGCELRIWGMLESPKSVSDIGGWTEWQAYFSTTGNRLMADYIGKAIKLSQL